MLAHTETPDPVLIVDDVERCARSLARLFEKRWSRAFVVCTSYKAALEAIDSRRRFAAAIIDLSLRPRLKEQEPDWLGLDLVKRVLAGHPRTQVLVLTGHMSGEVVHAVQAAGALYAMKGTSATRRIEELLAPLGRRFPSACRPALAPSAHAAAAGVWGLTPRQAEALQLVARGLSNKEVAASLGCSEGTVDHHVGALLRKARVDSRAGLVAAFWAQFVA